MRRALPVTFALLLATGLAAHPASAGKPKPKPITGSFTATGLPDPTPVAGTTCEPKLPTSKTEQPFTVPAKGILHVELENTLDWSVSVLDTDGTMEGCSDGSTPTDKEALDLPFKKKTKVIIRAANFAGEPSVTVKYVFTYK